MQSVSFCHANGRRCLIVGRTSHDQRCIIKCLAVQTQASKSIVELKQIDTLLEAGDETGALSLIAKLKEEGKVKGFSGARQVPKRIYTIEELRLNKIDAAKLLSPEDKSLNSVRTGAQVAAIAGLCALATYVGWDGAGTVLGTAVGLVFVLIADQVGNQGGGEALIADTLGRLTIRNYARRVAVHEAGHFLVAYLMGLLPKVYTLSALDAFIRFRALNIQAGTQFCDSEFQKQVASGKITSSSLDVYVCVALAGVMSEALLIGQAEGGVGDIAQLDALLRALGFTQKKADSEVRWAVLNVAEILRRHADIHDELAEAMQSGKSVGSCIDLIERKLMTASDV